jgi:ribosomal protein L11 methyltransferase
MPHLRRAFLVPPELEEPFAAELWAAGTLGVEMRPGPDGEVRIDAYFPLDAPAIDLAGWRHVQAAGEETIPETDWLAAYREQAKPFAVGRTLYVDPREPEEGPAPPPAGRRLLRLPARGAFGIGSHESTRLALELLEDLGAGELAGLDVLDVGTGTGILAFMALAGGARRAVAYDNDPAAPFYARDNARLNDLAPRLFAGSVGALAPPARFDLALVNVVPEQILPDLPALAALLAPGGAMILSGILVERGGEMLAAAAAFGFAERSRRIAGEWIAFHVWRRPA